MGNSLIQLLNVQGDFLGITKSDAQVGDSVEVVLNGVCGCQSGLMPGRYYYVHPNGAVLPYPSDFLTTDVIRAKAISDTEYIMNL